MRLHWRSAVLISLLLPYVACTADALLLWTLRLTSIRAGAAIGLILLILPLPLGLLALYWARGWGKIVLLLVGGLFMVGSLGWLFAVLDTLECYKTGRDPHNEIIGHLSTKYGAVVVYRDNGSAITRDAIVIEQEQPVMPGLKRTRSLYYQL